MNHVPPGSGENTGARSFGSSMIRKWTAALAVTLTLLTAAYLSGAAEDETFPHATHEGLFPNRCAACHGGIAVEGGAAFSVGPENCAHCHTGDMLDRVSWKGPRPGRINITFNHALHVGEMEMACADCHGAGDGPMDVKRADPAVCLNCHEAPDHLSAEADCRTCHLPLTEATQVSVERIAAYPKPAGHEDPEFLFKHGKTAAENIQRCATCHARNKCQVCHANADHVDLIQKLGLDSRVASLVKGATGEWPLPPTHTDDWDMEHAEAATKRIQTCANCHSQTFCITCHDAPGPTGWEQLPKEIPGGN